MPPQDLRQVLCQELAMFQDLIQALLQEALLNQLHLHQELTHLPHLPQLVRHLLPPQLLLVLLLSPLPLLSQLPLLAQLLNLLAHLFPLVRLPLPLLAQLLKLLALPPLLAHKSLQFNSAGARVPSQPPLSNLTLTSPSCPRFHCRFHKSTGPTSSPHPDLARTVKYARPQTENASPLILCSCRTLTLPTSLSATCHSMN